MGLVRKFLWGLKQSGGGQVLEHEDCRGMTWGKAGLEPKDKWENLGDKHSHITTPGHLEEMPYAAQTPRTLKRLGFLS